MPGASGPASAGGPWHQPIPAPWLCRSIPHALKGRMCPNHGINAETGLRQGLLLTAAVSTTLPTQLLPPCGHDGGTQALGLAPPHALRPVNTRLFARRVNLSAMLCPSYTGKHEPNAFSLLCPAQKRSAAAEASVESLRRSLRTGGSSSSASASPLSWPVT